MVAERLLEVVFGAMENVRPPLPLPPAALRLTQPAALPADQVQSVPVVTPMVPEPPAAANARLLAVTV
jgi:hypothetical protein